MHKVLCSAAEIACKERQEFYLGNDGGYMISIHSKIGQGMKIHLREIGELAWKERTHSHLSRKQHSQFLPELRSEINRDRQCEGCRAVFCEGDSTVRKRVCQSSALVSPTTTLNRDVAPTGDDIEPMGESRADVETGKEEEEVFLEFRHFHR